MAGLSTEALPPLSEITGYFPLPCQTEKNSKPFEVKNGAQSGKFRKIIICGLSCSKKDLTPVSGEYTIGTMIDTQQRR